MKLGQTRGCIGLRLPTCPPFRLAFAQHAPQGGGFLDDRTATVTVDMLLYNPFLGCIFAYYSPSGLLLCLPTPFGARAGRPALARGAWDTA